MIWYIIVANTDFFLSSLLVHGDDEHENCDKELALRHGGQMRGRGSRWRCDEVSHVVQQLQERELEQQLLGWILEEDSRTSVGESVSSLLLALPPAE